LLAIKLHFNVYLAYIFCNFLSFIAGVWHSEPEALRLAQAIVKTEGVELTGVYAHCGNTYHCSGVREIQAVAQETTTLTLQFMEKYGPETETCGPVVRPPLSGG